MKYLQLKVPPLLLLVFMIIALFILPRPPLVDASFQNWLTAIALAILLIAMVIILCALSSFVQHQTSVDPMAPDKADTLVVTGIFRYTRNPMYLGFLCIVIATGVYLNSVYVVLIAPLFVCYLTFFQIIPEENILRHKFRQQYRQYCHRVRRWL